MVFLNVCDDELFVMIWGYEIDAGMSICLRMINRCGVKRIIITLSSLVKSNYCDIKSQMLRFCSLFNNAINIHHVKNWKGYLTESNASKPGQYKSRRVSMETIQSVDGNFDSEYHILGTDKNTMKMKRTHHSKFP